MKNSSSQPNPFLMIWIVTLSIFTLLCIFSAIGMYHPLWLLVPGIGFAIVVYDSIQTKHTLRRNYPLIARVRYFLESIRPEFRQYFFEGELDGKPFNRRQRSLVYQRAKGEKQTIPFGMQDDPYKPGYEWVPHSLYPKTTEIDSFRVQVGGKECKQPYSMSVFNISAMSYGALSKTAITALNIGAKEGKFAHNTGEGGISDYHLSGGDLVWQLGTGYFGARNSEGNFDEEVFIKKAAYPQVKMIEIKLSQGAKPGHGGLLPAHKNTPEIAAIRHIEPYTAVHSPPSHSAFSNANGLLKFVQRLREVSDGKPVGFKLCIGNKSEFTEIVNEMKSTGILPDFITVDGGEGGTGAAPLEYIDHLGLSLDDGLSFVHKSLKEANLRDEIKIIASGKIITAFDIAKHISLGADIMNSARGMMFALGCIQALQCDEGTCPVGIATQNPKFFRGINVPDKARRVASFHKSTMDALFDLTGSCGIEKLSEFRNVNFYRRMENHSYKSLEELYSQV